MSKRSLMDRKRDTRSGYAVIYYPESMSYLLYNTIRNLKYIKLFYTFKMDEARPGKIILTGLRAPVPKHIVIPQCVSVIESLTTAKGILKKFCPQIRSVYIGDGVEEIGAEAFRGLGLECVNMQESLSLKKIGKNAFADNKLAEPLPVPRGTEVDGDIGCAYIRCKRDYPTFEYLTKMEGPFLHDEEGDGLYIPFFVRDCFVNKFPDYISRLGDLHNGNYLGTIKIESIRKIDAGAFKGSNLERVHISEKSTLTEIESDTFADCKLKEIVLPSSVTKIAEGALGDIRSIEHIVADGCPEIKKLFRKKGVFLSAKEFFENLENHNRFAYAASRKYGKVDTITGFAKNLTEEPSEIVIPKDFKRIADNAFVSCTFLKRAVVEKDVKFSRTEDPIELVRKHDAFPPWCEVVTPEGEVLQAALTEQEVVGRKLMARYLEKYIGAGSALWDMEKVSRLRLRFYCRDHKNCKDFSEFVNQEGQPILRGYCSNIYESGAAQKIFDCLKRDNYYGSYNPKVSFPFSGKNMLAFGDFFYAIFKEQKPRDYRYKDHFYHFVWQPDASPVLYCYQNCDIPKSRKAEIAERVKELQAWIAAVQQEEDAAVARFEAWLKTPNGSSCLRAEEKLVRKINLEAAARRSRDSSAVPRKETSTEFLERCAKTEENGGHDAGAYYCALGRNYKDGRGVPRDLLKAYEYFQKVDFHSKSREEAWRCMQSIENELLAERKAAEAAATSAAGLSSNWMNQSQKEIKPTVPQFSRPRVSLSAVTNAIEKAAESRLRGIGIVVTSYAENFVACDPYENSYYRTAHFDVEVISKQKDIEEFGRASGGGGSQYAMFANSLQRNYGLKTDEIWTDRETRQGMTSGQKKSLDLLQTRASIASASDSSSAYIAGKEMIRSAVKGSVQQCWNTYSGSDITDTDRNGRQFPVKGWSISYKFPKR